VTFEKNESIHLIVIMGESEQQGRDRTMQVSLENLKKMDHFQVKADTLLIVAGQLTAAQMSSNAALKGSHFSPELSSRLFEKHLLSISKVLTKQKFVVIGYTDEKETPEYVGESK